MNPLLVASRETARKHIVLSENRINVQYGVVSVLFSWSLRCVELHRCVLIQSKVESRMVHEVVVPSFLVSVALCAGLLHS